MRIIFLLVFLVVAGCTPRPMAKPTTPTPPPKETEFPMKELEEEEFVAHPPTAFERMAWEMVERESRKNKVKEASADD